MLSLVLKAISGRIKSVIIFFGVLVVLAMSVQMWGETTVFTSAIANLATNHNFYTVVPGRFYRSGQMNAESLDSLIKQNSIKTVIDLRLDPNEKDDGSITEKWTAEVNGATYYHVKLSSAKVPKIESVQQLLDIYDRAQPPILAHCSSGTHRTGFAAFLWMVDKEGASLDVALEQLSLKYGFVVLERRLKAWFQSAPTLDSVVWAYRDADPQSRNEPFREWIKKYIDSNSNK